MGRYLRSLALFCTVILLLSILASCVTLDEGEGTETTTTATVTTTVTTATPPPEEPPPADSGYDEDGFENRPEDDETKRY